MLVGTKNFQVELYQVSSLHCFYIARSVAMKHLRIFNLNNGCHYFGNVKYRNVWSDNHFTIQMLCIRNS